MLLVLSISIPAFAVALLVFVYLFDRYMGASDTGYLADTMSNIREHSVATPKQSVKRSRAATGA